MEKKRHFHDAETFFGGAVGANTTSAEAEASSAMRKGMALFLERAGTATPKDKLKGNLLEYIEVARFNEKSALQGSNVTAKVTAANGEPQAPADIKIINKSGKVVKEIQAKVSDKSSLIARKQTDPKYRGMDRLTTKDKAGEVRRLSEERTEYLAKRKDSRSDNYRESAGKTTGELVYGKVRSDGTTTSELAYATKNSRLFAIKEELRAVGREAGRSGLHAVYAGAVMEVVISSIKNFYAYSEGDIDGKKAATNIVIDTTKSSVRSGSTGAIGPVIRHVADKADLQTLTKSNVATAVAASLIEVGLTIYDYAKGEIPAEVVVERLGNTGCSTLAGICTGVAAGVIFGPAGAVYGSIAGYMLSTSVYQSCIAILKGACLAEEEVNRIVILCEQAANSMDRQREYFEIKLDEYLGDRKTVCDSHFNAIDDAIITGQTEGAILALSDLVASCGREMKLAKFEDFDEFMTKSDTPLVF